MSDDKVITLREWNPAEAAKPKLLDIPKCLRGLADAIERGDHGEVVRLAMVLRSNDREPIILGQGETDIATTFMDLHAGAQELLMMGSSERS